MGNADRCPYQPFGHPLLPNQPSPSLPPKGARGPGTVSQPSPRSTYYPRVTRVLSALTPHDAAPRGPS